MSAYHCSVCGVELTPYIQTPCPKSASGLHSINEDDFKAAAKDRQDERTAFERDRLRAGIERIAKKCDHCFSSDAKMVGAELRALIEEPQMPVAIRAAMKTKQAGS